jgi:hypothetical protein
MPSKKKRKAPRIMKWVEMGCEGVDKQGRLRKGFGPPAAKGQCPKPSKAQSRKRTAGIVARVRDCAPLFRKAAGTGFKKGYKQCLKSQGQAAPSDSALDRLLSIGKGRNVALRGSGARRRRRRH